jgi:histidine triad (HIT) family protein
MSYDANNIFANILRGEIPCHKIYEDEATLAFMDVMPQVDGHCLVIPKQGSRNLLDADPAVFGPLMATVQKVARATKKAFGAEGVLIKQFNEPAAGQTVFHLHVHVLPRIEGIQLRPHIGQMADHTVLAMQAGLIRAALD